MNKTLGGIYTPYVKRESVVFIALQLRIYDKTPDAITTKVGFTSFEGSQGNGHTVHM